MAEGVDGGLQFQDHVKAKLPGWRMGRRNPLSRKRVIHASVRRLVDGSRGGACLQQLAGGVVHAHLLVANLGKGALLGAQAVWQQQQGAGQGSACRRGVVGGVHDSRVRALDLLTRVVEPSRGSQKLTAPFTSGNAVRKSFIARA